MNKLKRCPFCACSAKAYQAYDGKWQVECFRRSGRKMEQEGK